MGSAVSLGQLTSFREIAPMGDPRFGPAVTAESLRCPVDFLRAGHSGVYIRDSLDADRTSVLFIHGINSSPRMLEPLIDGLQPMYFYYASGSRAEQMVWQLDHIMRGLKHSHGIERYHVFQVWAGWLRKHAGGRRAETTSFTSLSIPWLGYPSARQGVGYSPVVVPVWPDMPSGSEFLADLLEDGAADRMPPIISCSVSASSAGCRAGPVTVSRL